MSPLFATTNIMKRFLVLLSSILLLLPMMSLAHWPHDTIDGMIVSPSGRTIILAVRLVLFRSTDYGATWEYVRSLRESPREWYMALSPDEQILYLYDGGKMTRTEDFIEWETINSIKPCTTKYYHRLKNRATFVQDDKILIAGDGVLFKEKGASFEKILYADFDNCPSLASVNNGNTVYAGASTGLVKSEDGGYTWKLLVPMTDIIEVVATEGEVFVMTMTSICHLNKGENACIDIGFPGIPSAHKVRSGPSPPLGITYKDGVLIVVCVNSYAVYATDDYTDPKAWRYTSQVDGDFVTPGHFGKDAWGFEEAEEFTHVQGNVVGGWLGVFTTDDGARTWTYHDTIRLAFTYFSVIKASPKDGGHFTVAACTYAAGCIKGKIGGAIKPHPIEEGFYESLHLSPSYDSDGIGFENAKKKLYYIDGGGEVALQTVTPGAEVSVKGLIFTPNFRDSGTLFVFGYGIGVLASYDYGVSFSRIFDGRGWDIMRMVISPNYVADGTMACLVDPDFDGKRKGAGDIMYIYGTQDFGATWRRLQNGGMPWRDLIIVEDNPAPTVVALDKSGILWTHTSAIEKADTKFVELQNAKFPNTRPKGFGFDGLAVSPDGNTLATAWAEGHVMISTIVDNTATDRRWGRPNPWNTRGEIPKIFAKMPPPVADVVGRTFSSHIVFSPEYETDSTIFACDMFSIYRSTTEGFKWEKVFTLQG